MIFQILFSNFNEVNMVMNNRNNNNNNDISKLISARHARLEKSTLVTLWLKIAVVRDLVRTIDKDSNNHAKHPP